MRLVDENGNEVSFSQQVVLEVNRDGPRQRKPPELFEAGPARLRQPLRQLDRNSGAARGAPGGGGGDDEVSKVGPDGGFAAAFLGWVGGGGDQSAGVYDEVGADEESTQLISQDSLVPSAESGAGRRLSAISEVNEDGNPRSAEPAPPARREDPYREKREQALLLRARSQKVREKLREIEVNPVDVLQRRGVRVKKTAHNNFDRWFKGEYERLVTSGAGDVVARRSDDEGTWAKVFLHVCGKFRPDSAGDEPDGMTVLFAANHVARAALLGRFVRTAQKHRPGQKTGRYDSESMRGMLNGIQKDLHDRALEMVKLNPQLEGTEMARKWSWSDLTGQFAHFYGEVRLALKDLAHHCQNDDTRVPGQGDSTKPAALTYEQLLRIQDFYEDHLEAVQASSVRLPFLGEIKNNGYSPYADELEVEQALFMLDLGQYGGGRANQDYSFYNVSDFYIMKLGVMVVEGDPRKTSRMGKGGKYIGREPFFIPGEEPKRRFRLLASGRGQVEGMDKYGRPLVNRLFLRPLKSVKRGDENLWSKVVVGFRSSDPVRLVNKHFVDTAGWSTRIRTLGSFRYMLQTGLCTFLL